MILSLSDGTTTASCDNRSGAGVLACGAAGFLTSLDSTSILFNGLLGDPWTNYNTSVTASSRMLLRYARNVGRDGVESHEGIRSSRHLHDLCHGLRLRPSDKHRS